MACDLKLQITNYNIDTHKKESLLTSIGTIEEDQKVDINQIAYIIANLDKETRNTLAAQLRAAKVQNVTNSTVKEHQIVSNITLNDLTVKYPDLGKYNIPKDLEYQFTLLQCYRAEFNGSVYKGRTVDSKGNEIFIINNVYDAEKLFKHLSAKLNLHKFIQGNTVDESLQEFAEDLQVIAKHYHKDIQKLIEDFLINKHAYNTFRQGDKLYSPKRLINKVLSRVTGDLYDEGDKSDLQLELEAIKEVGSTSNEWKLEKKRLYNVLITFNSEFAQQYSYEQFKELDTETLNSLLTSLFSSDVKLMKASVKSSTKGKKIIKDAPLEKQRVRVKSDIIQQTYNTVFLTNNPDFPKKYQDAAKKYGYAFKQMWERALQGNALQITDELGVVHDCTIEMDEKYKFTIFYEVDKAPVIKEQNSFITLSLNNWSSIGDTYDFSYASQPLFTLTEKYKGFYIYEFHKDGITHYAISRSIISPHAYMKTFSSLNYAKQAIENNQETLMESGLWSIKQHIGRPRTSKLEMKSIREGQIITTLDLELPRFTFEKFSDKVKDLFKGTLANFHNELSFIPGIQALDSPEKAVAFIYLAHKQVGAKGDFFELLESETQLVQNIIASITEAPTVSYLVEKETSYGKKNKEYQLKLLQNNGTNVQVDGTFGDITIQDFADQNMNTIIEYFNNQIKLPSGQPLIKAITRSELIALSTENNLGLEDKVDTVRGFVFNGQIYINTSNANAADIFHELSHIFLGVLKATNLQAYNEIVTSYQKKNTYNYQFNKHRKTYQHYSEQDVIEETVADLLAEELFKSKKLGESQVQGDALLSLFEEIFKRSQSFVNDIKDNGLGFSRYMGSLLNENLGTVQRNMKISDLVKQYIKEGKITENC